MIPNSVPMAAVYHRPSATGSRDGKLFSRPVVAWGENSGEGLVPDPKGRLIIASATDRGITFLGLWQRGWTPSYDEMASLLPDYTPGTRHPLTVDVEIRETPSHRWAAVRLSDQKTEVDAADVGTLKERLSVLGHFHVTRIVGLGEH